MLRNRASRARFIPVSEIPPSKIIEAFSVPKNDSLCQLISYNFFFDNSLFWRLGHIGEKMAVITVASPALIAKNNRPMALLPVSSNPIDV
jgi:hypothetical protein